MTTQNRSVERYAFANLADGTTAYYPAATGTDGDGFDDITFRVFLKANDADNTLIVTVESDDGVTGTFAWDETRGIYNWMTGAYGAASFVANNSSVYARLLALNHNAKKWRVKLVVSAKGGGPNHNGAIEIYKVKV
jgi:hypothetical protein